MTVYIAKRYLLTCSRYPLWIRICCYWGVRERHKLDCHTASRTTRWASSSHRGCCCCSSSSSRRCFRAGCRRRRRSRSYSDRNLPRTVLRNLVHSIQAFFVKLFQKSLTKTDYLPLKWSVTGGFCTSAGNRKSGMKKKRIGADRNVFQIIIQRNHQFFGHICRMKDARMLKASVWCDGGQLHGKGDHVENGRMISRIGARKTCTHWDGRQPTGLSGRGLLDNRHAIDTNGSPRPSSQRKRR